MKPPATRPISLAVSISVLAATGVAAPAWAEPAERFAAAPEETSRPSALDRDAPAAPPATEAGGPGGTELPQRGVAAGAQTGDEGSAARHRASSKRRRLGGRTLREGMRGSDVRHLQKVLTGMNLDTPVSGRYGRATKRSVRRYDRWREGKVNGVVHMQQAKRMKRLYRRGVRYRKHVFPVRGPHDYGGAGSRFGAPRSGHRHQGQDVAAAEGTRVVAVHEGRVAFRSYQAAGAGHYVVIHGKEGSDSVYMHLQAPARVRPGRRVMAGQTIGRVGTTGSSTGPHLHFELWTRHWYDGGDPYDPLRKLKRWDRGS